MSQAGGIAAHVYAEIDCVVPGRRDFTRFEAAPEKRRIRKQRAVFDDKIVDVAAVSASIWILVVPNQNSINHFSSQRSAYGRAHLRPAIDGQMPTVALSAGMHADAPLVHSAGIAQRGSVGADHIDGDVG